MTAGIALRLAVIALALAATKVSAKESVPIVYEDDYVTVHAGLLESGSRVVHFGDPLSLVIDAVFDARQVQIENLDDDVFQRVFSAMPNIRLYAPTIVTTQKVSGDRVQVTGVWRLQVLDCPNGLTHCPGPRSYDLPVMTIAYQLIDDAGNTADGRAARFRPWPGKIDIVSAIAVVPEAGTTVTDILPGGAYDSPQRVAELAPARSVLLAAGVLLLLTGFLASARERGPQLFAPRPRDSDSRWELTLARLKDDTMPDDEWSDLLRRCVTWYCMDELGRNPYTWLGAAAQDAASDTPTGVRDFFLDVLHQESIDPARRTSYLDRLLGVTEHVRDAQIEEQQK